MEADWRDVLRFVCCHLPAAFWKAMKTIRGAAITVISTIVLLAGAAFPVTRNVMLDYRWLIGLAVAVWMSHQLTKTWYTTPRMALLPAPRTDGINGYHLLHLENGGWEPLREVEVEIEAFDPPDSRAPIALQFTNRPVGDKPDVPAKRSRSVNLLKVENGEIWIPSPLQKQSKDGSTKRVMLDWQKWTFTVLATAAGCDPVCARFEFDPDAGDGYLKVVDDPTIA